MSFKLVPLERYGSILHHLRDNAKHWSKIVIFSYLPCIRRPRKGVLVGILPSRLVW